MIEFKNEQLEAIKNIWGEGYIISVKLTKYPNVSHIEINRNVDEGCNWGMRVVYFNMESILLNQGQAVIDAADDDELNKIMDTIKILNRR